jgi:hypothetical protein
MFKGKVSPVVQNAYDKSDYAKVMEVYHLIEPDRSVMEPGPFNKPWKSIYWDMNDKRDEALLEKRGFDEKPFFGVRWDVVGNDAYGYGPGHDALAEMRRLQVASQGRDRVRDFIEKPEMVNGNANVAIKRMPGAITTAPGATAADIFVPYQVPYQSLEAVREEIAEVRASIDDISNAALFMAITNMTGIQPRNMEEIAARNEEKMTQLGPVIDRVNNEMLAVVIERMFGLMSRGGLLPPPPEGLGEIEVQFTSILARMQRAVGIGQIERHVGFVGNLAGVSPEALDNLDFDQAVREHADRTGVPDRLTASVEAVEKKRQQRAQQQQAEQMAAMAPAMQQGADAARLLSETDVGGTPALDLVLGQ